jgi:hypothetical protein
MASKRLRAEGDKDEPIKLNVGGRRFELSLQTANAFGYLRARLNAGFSRETDDKGYMFIDRDPSIFETVLQCVRDNGRQVLHETLGLRNVALIVPTDSAAMAIIRGHRKKKSMRGSKICWPSVLSGVLALGFPSASTARSAASSCFAERTGRYAS